MHPIHSTQYTCTDILPNLAATIPDKPHPAPSSNTLLGLFNTLDQIPRTECKSEIKNARQIRNQSAGCRTMVYMDNG
jgi:hypothetical protein